TRGVVDHRLGDRPAARQGNRQGVRPYLIPGAVRRIGDVESPRGAHRVGEFNARAVAESYTAVIEVASTGTAHHQDRLRRAGQRRRAAVRIAPRTRIVDEALCIGAGRAIGDADVDA